VEEASDLETDAGLAPVPPLGVVPGDFDVSIFNVVRLMVSFAVPRSAIASPSIFS